MQDQMKVGALARRTGMTVRTLHHYDEIGLLSPSGRTPSGHRLYGADEVRRLQQIASLRQLGLSLEEIRDCLRRPDYSLGHILDLHLERIDEQIRGQQRLRATVERLRSRLTEGAGASVDELLESIHETIAFEKYYSDEQLKWLADRRNDVGEDRIVAVQGEWQALYDDFARAMEAGEDPASTRVQALVARSSALVAEFTGGDAAIDEGLRRMYSEEDPEAMLKQQGMRLPSGLWDYMAKANAAAALGRPAS